MPGIDDQLQELIILISPQLSEKGKRDMKALRQELIAAQEAGTRAGHVLGTGLPAAIDNLQRSGRAGVAGVNRMRTGLAALATQAAGVTGPLGNVASSLLVFSAGSATLLGIVAGIALIGTAWEHMTADAVAAEEATTKALLKVQELSRQQFLGDSPATAALQLAAERQGLERERQRLQDQLTAAEGDDVGQNLTQLAKRRTLTAEILKLDAEILIKTREIQKANKDADQDATRFAEKEADRIQRDLEKSRRESEEAFRNRVRPLTDDIKALASDATASELNALIFALGEIESLTGKIADTAKLSVGGKKPINAFQLQKMVDDLRRNDLIDRLGNIIAGGGGGLGGGVDDGRSAQDELVEINRQMTDLARGAVATANAFGGISDETAIALQNVLGLTDALGTAVATGGSLGSVLGAAGSVIGIVAGILGGGESPAERERREALDRNSEAIERLRATLGEFGLDITGDQLSSVRQFLAGPAGQRVVGARGSVIENVGLLDIPQELRDAILDVARMLDVDLKGSFENLKDAVDAVELGRLADTLQGQVSIADRIASITQATDLQRLLELQDLAVGKQFGFGLGRGLGAFDLNTSGGRDAARDLVVSILNQLRGGATIPDGMFGGLTPTEAIDFLSQFGDLINRVNALGEIGGTTEQFGISQTITVAQASHIAGILQTSALYLEAIETNTAATAENTLRSSELLEQMTVGQAGIAITNAPAASRTIGDLAASRARDLGNNRIA